MLSNETLNETYDNFAKQIYSQTKKTISLCKFVEVKNNFN